MITLFAIPKPFEGESARLQSNAIGSWRALAPDAEILLLGNDAGTAEAARQFGAAHVPEIAQTEWGTPRVDDIFGRAESAARFPLLCYINADIVLTSSFFRMVRAAASRPASARPMLVVGCRWDLDVADTLDFSDPAWEASLREILRERGSLHAESGIDYFLFQKNFWPCIPPFGVGRTMWDNWFIFQARAQGAIVADATPSVIIVHQNHGYGHHAEGWQGVWKGPEAERNSELAGGLDHYFTIADSTHWWTDQGLQRRWDAESRARFWQTLPELWPPAAWVRCAARYLGRKLYAAREQIARWRGRI